MFRKKVTTEKYPPTIKAKREFWSYFLIIFSVLLFRSVLFEPFKIPSGSMIPSLLIGDYILVNKFSYGLKLPFSDWFKDPIYVTGPYYPKRGDVVVFKFPNNPTLNYIKRVVGLPGDKIDIYDKVVYINGEPIEVKTVDGAEIMSDMDDRYKDKNFQFFEAKTGEHVHIVQHDIENHFSANYTTVNEQTSIEGRVPPGHYFVMGDNRDNSSDSRVWGFVPFENIKGEARYVWFSLSLPLQVSNVEGNSFKFRPWRIGKKIP